MSRAMKLVNFILGSLLLLLVMYGIETAHADGKRHDGGDVDIDIGGTEIDIGATTVDVGNSVIGGDTNISTGGNKSLAVVTPGLGDVDIAQCLGSTQWSLLVGGKQKLVLNQVCMAEFYLKQARYDLAAQALCNQPEILNEYSTEAACEAAHDFTPAIPAHVVHTRSDEFEEAYAQQEEEIEYLQEENASIVGRLDDLTALLEQAPSAAPVYVQQASEPKYTDDQFDAVWAALGKGDEDE